MSKYILEVKLDEDFPEELKDYYLNYNCNGQDSGIDLIIPEDIFTNFPQVATINHKISCQMIRQNSDNTEQYVSYWLLPRSSISKTNYRMANSVGLIDSGYRGNIMAKVDLVVDNKEDIYLGINNIKPSTRLFQIATGDLTPISEVRVVSELSKTDRGSGSFGSTG